jgi:hypothetical protein
MRGTVRPIMLFFLGAVVALCSACPGNPTFDLDGDGSADSIDCAPADPEVHPAADEICDDGIDNDCDGDVDGDDTDCGGTPDDDDAADDDDTVMPEGHRTRLCATAGTATNTDYSLTTCTGPLELAPGMSSNDVYTLVTGVLQPVGTQ